jgi:hypothetical protein
VSISAKTRKLLWSRAHDACAMCRKRLTEEAASASMSGLILGEEAHIIAQREDGPRGHDGDRSDIDGYDNLILLCADDHKRVDEQPDVYTVEFLRNAKRAHEQWAASKMTEEHRADPIVQVKAPGEDGIPLMPVLSGAQVWGIVARAGLTYYHPAEGVDREAAAACDAFLDGARDWGDIAEDVEVQGFAAIRDAQDSLQELLLDVWEHDMFVYGRRFTRTIKGGVSAPAPWPVGELVVLTGDDVRRAAEEHGLEVDCNPASASLRSDPSSGLCEDNIPTAMYVSSTTSIA